MAHAEIDLNFKLKLVQCADAQNSLATASTSQVEKLFGTVAPAVRGQQSFIDCEDVGNPTQHAYILFPFSKVENDFC